MQLNVKFGFSKVKGEFPLDKCETKEERVQFVDTYIDSVVDGSEEDFSDIDDELSDLE